MPPVVTPEVLNTATFFIICILNPSIHRTPALFWGRNTWRKSGLAPQRGCRPKRATWYSHRSTSLSCIKVSKFPRPCLKLFLESGLRSREDETPWAPQGQFQTCSNVRPGVHKERSLHGDLICKVSHCTHTPIVRGFFSTIQDAHSIKCGTPGKTKAGIYSWGTVVCLADFGEKRANVWVGSSAREGYRSSPHTQQWREIKQYAGG